MLEIDFQSEGFPTAGPIKNGFDYLSFSWNDLLWAAITVGRPNRNFVFRYGIPSFYEALFRYSLIRMSVEQSGPGGWRLKRTLAAKTLDPSEKSAVNYFIGLTLCKLFAGLKLDIPWLLHLDVFRASLNPTFLRGRSRPDLIGWNGTGEYIAIESKGRGSPPDGACKTKAKEQAKRVLSINGRKITYAIGSVAYFKKDVLSFYWCDPPMGEADPANSVHLQVTEDEMWREYYRLFWEMIQTATRAAREGNEFFMPEADLAIRIVPEIVKLLQLERWSEAGRWCLEHPEAIVANETHQDGVQVIAGGSWQGRHE